MQQGRSRSRGLPKTVRFCSQVIRRTIGGILSSTRHGASEDEEVCRLLPPSFIFVIIFREYQELLLKVISLQQTRRQNNSVNGKKVRRRKGNEYGENFLKNGTCSDLFCFRISDVLTFIQRPQKDQKSYSGVKPYLYRIEENHRSQKRQSSQHHPILHIQACIYKGLPPYNIGPVPFTRHVEHHTPMFIDKPKLAKVIGCQDHQHLLSIR